MRSIILESAKQLFEAMSPGEAIAIFSRHAPGYDIAHMKMDDLKSLWKKLLLKYHPDKGGDAELAKDINQAYDILKNPNVYRSRAYSSHQASPKTRSKEEFPWAWAGHRGGAPPTHSIYRNDYTDLNYIKKTMWEKSGKSHDEYTVYQFDGRYWRNLFTVYGSKDIYRDMTEAMLVWGQSGNSYHTDAIFVRKDRSTKVQLIWLRGNFLPVDKTSIYLFDVSYLNSTGSASERLKRELDRIHEKTSVSLQQKTEATLCEDQYLDDVPSREGEIAYQVVHAFESNKNGKQWWKLVPFASVKKIWGDFADKGYVRDERGMLKIASQLIDNVLQLYVNSVLAGHTSQNPEEYLKEIDSELEWTEEDFDKFYDYIEDERGQLKISDIADKLYGDAMDLAAAKTAEEQLMLADKILQRVHMRGDLAANFIEGGYKSLNMLSDIGAMEEDQA